MRALADAPRQYAGVPAETRVRTRKPASQLVRVCHVLAVISAIAFATDSGSRSGSR
jgi:hypothetical protein